VNINLQKMLKAEIWEAALLGTSGGKVDPYTAEQEKKKLMLERFQVRSASQLHPKPSFIAQVLTLNHLSLSSPGGASRLRFLRRGV
jgi:hypothetical protein